MPVINGEAAYEMLGDKLPTEVDAADVLAVHDQRRGRPHVRRERHLAVQPPGPAARPVAASHGGVGYGKIPWNEAMNLPGSRQVGLGKKLFEKFAWQKFAPHPEWAQPTSAIAADKPTWGQWIWYPEGEPTKDAPVAKRYFRKTFELSPDDRSKARSGSRPTTIRRVLEWRTNRASTLAPATCQPIDVSSKLKAGARMSSPSRRKICRRQSPPIRPGLLASLLDSNDVSGKSM